MSEKERMNDNQLLESCLKGDVEEYRKIVDKYRGKVMAMAWNMLGNREDAQDASQDTFIRAYQNLNRFDFQHEFKDWLFTILYNRCYDLLRKRQSFFKLFSRLKSEPVDFSAGQPSNPRREFSIKQSLLKELNAKERIAVILWANESYTSPEISSVLGCTASTARVHLFKARKKIKALMEKQNVEM